MLIDDFSACTAHKYVWKKAMDYDYLSSVLSNYTNLSSLTNKAGNVLSGVSAVNDAVGATSATNSFSSVLDAVIKASGVSEDSAQELRSLASVNADTGLESEARSNLIMQNYLSAALMQDTLQNSLTDSADFTSSLFENLAVGTMGDDDSSSGSMLGSLQESTLNAISNMSTYQNLLQNALTEVEDEQTQGTASRAANSDAASISDLAASLGLTGLSGSSVLTGLNNISDLANIYGLSGLSGLANLDSAV